MEILYTIYIGKQYIMNRRRNMAISNNVLVNNKTLRGFLLIGQVPVTSEVTAYIEICDIEVTEF